MLEAPEPKQHPKGSLWGIAALMCVGICVGMLFLHRFLNPPLGNTAPTEDATLVRGVPDYVIDYAASYDGLYRVTRLSQFPDIDERLKSLDVREAFWEWLATPEALRSNKTHVAIAALRTVHRPTSTSKKAVLRRFFKHESYRVVFQYSNTL